MIERAVFHVLNEHKQGSFIVIRKVVLDDVVALTETHDCDFLFNLLKVLLDLDGDYPDSVDFTFVLMGLNFIDLTHATFTYLINEHIELSRLILYYPNLLQLNLKFLSTQQLSFEFTLINFIAIIGNDIDIGTHILRQLRKDGYINGTIF